jgi:CelD/BcsL family acetyltransferase involved in cellulose biosynthesis
LFSERADPAVTGSPAERITHSGAAALRVEAFTDPRSLAALGPAWNRLLEESGADHPFLTHQWMCAWWDAFGSGHHPFVLLVTRGSRPVAIAPLMLGRSELFGLRLRRLGLIANEHTPRCDLIVARGEEEAYDAVWGYLAEHRDRWDVLELNQVPSCSPTLGRMADRARADRFLVGLSPSHDSPYVPLDGGWDRVRMGLRRNLRSGMPYRLRRLGRRGQVRLEIVRTIDDSPGALEDGLRIEAAAWKSRSGTAILSEPDVERFYSALARAAGAAGQLRLIFLTLDDRRIAFAYGLCYRRKLHVIKLGYEPEYASCSPYNLLCYLLMQEACRQGLEQYEFLGAADPWKLNWSRLTKGHAWLYAFRPSLRARLLHGLMFTLLPALRGSRALRRLRDRLPPIRLRRRQRRSGGADPGERSRAKTDPGAAP